MGLNLSTPFLEFYNILHSIVLFISHNDALVCARHFSSSTLKDCVNLVNGGNVCGYNYITPHTLDNHHTCGGKGEVSICVGGIGKGVCSITEANSHGNVGQPVKSIFSCVGGHSNFLSFHNSFSFWLCVVLLCTFIIAQISYLSSVFFIFCGALCKHHSQKHETQNANTQTASTQDISSDVIIVLSVVHGTLVCVVDVPADAVANVAKLSLDVFHGLFPLSFICLYYSTKEGALSTPLLDFFRSTQLRESSQLLPELLLHLPRCTRMRKQECGSTSVSDPQARSDSRRLPDCCKQQRFSQLLSPLLFLLSVCIITHE